MSTNFFKTTYFVFTFFCCTNPFISIAQVDNPAPDQIQSTILQLDSIFWTAYNTCDTEKMKTFLTDDIEFYHDVGGLTTPLNVFMKTIENSLCGDKNFQLRREAVEGTIKVYPMNNYGAIISGEHLFYINETGKKERLDGAARFTHLWKYENKTWKMSRVLSYDHGPAPQQTVKQVIILSDKILQQYVGQYQAPNTGKVMIEQLGETLKMSAGQMNAIIFPESEQVFFVEGQDLTFEFVKNKLGQVEKMIVREQGQVVEEAKRVPLNSEKQANDK